MLTLHLKAQANPWSEDSGGPYYVHCGISYQHNNVVIPSFVEEWDILELLEFFLENEEKLLKEEYPYINLQGKCIAEKFAEQCARFENINNELGIEYYDDILVKYLGAHHFRLEGSIMPSHYVGLNDGIGELSYFDDASSAYVSYAFDMPAFLSNVFAECKKAITDWREKYFTPEAYNRIVELQKYFGKDLGV